MTKKFLLIFLFFALILKFTISQNSEKVNINSKDIEIPELYKSIDTDEPFYSIQIGVYKFKRTKLNFKNLEDLYYTKRPKNVWRILSGIYTSQDSVFTALNEIYRKGYSDAYILLFDGKNAKERVFYPDFYFEKTKFNDYIAIEKQKFDSLKNSIERTNKKLNEFEQTYNNKIDVLTNQQKAKTLISPVKKIIKYQDFIVLGAIILIIFSIIFLFIFIKKKFKHRSELVEIQLNEARRKFIEKLNQVRDELIEQNNQTKKMFILSEIVNTLPFGKQQNSISGNVSNVETPKLLNKSQSKKPDHSVAINLADEIIKMKGKLLEIPEDTPGRDNLLNVIKNVEKEFDDTDYEISDLVGLTYKKDMNLTANFVLSKGQKSVEQIITKIIKPQILYKGKIIQTAEVEVSY
jgi:hypothetical protein